MLFVGVALAQSAWSPCDALPSNLCYTDSFASLPPSEAAVVRVVDGG